MALANRNSKTLPPIRKASLSLYVSLVIVIFCASNNECVFFETYFHNPQSIHSLDTKKEPFFQKLPIPIPLKSIKKSHTLVN